MEENRGEDRRLPELIRLSMRPATCPEDKAGNRFTFSFKEKKHARCERNSRSRFL